MLHKGQAHHGEQILRLRRRRASWAAPPASCFRDQRRCRSASAICRSTLARSSSSLSRFMRCAWAISVPSTMLRRATTARCHVLGTIGDSSLASMVSGQHIRAQRQRRPKPDGVHQMIGAWRRGVGMNEHAQAVAMQRQPRHQIGKNGHIERHLVHRLGVRADRRLVPATELHPEALRRRPRARIRPRPRVAAGSKHTCACQLRIVRSASTLMRALRESRKPDLRAIARPAAARVRRRGSAANDWPAPWPGRCSAA